MFVHLQVVFATTVVSHEYGRYDLFISSNPCSEVNRGWLDADYRSWVLPEIACVQGEDDTGRALRWQRLAQHWPCERNR